MGGIGKTELALQYAIEQFNQEQYPGGVCWLRARGQDIITEITSFAQSFLGLVLPEGLNERKQVDFCWGHWREGDVLVVLDDVTDFDAIEPYLPPSNPRFKVLITTRLNLGKAFCELFIKELDDKSAFSLLSSFVEEKRIQIQRAEAEALCTWVGNLPIGLELLGHYLANKKDWSFQKLVDQLDSKRLEAKALAYKKSGTTAQLGVASTLELSWIELSKAEQELACLLSMFGISPIPWQLLEKGLNSREIDRLMDHRDVGLISKNLFKQEKDGYQLHPIIREFFRSKLTAKKNHGRRLKKKFLSILFETTKNISSDYTLDNIKIFQASIPHLEELLNQWVDLVSDKDILLPYIGVVQFYERQGNYKLAEIWNHRCINTISKRLGNTNLYIATCFNSLAGINNKKGQYLEAEPLYKKSLQIFKELNEQQSIANNLNDLAILYENQGRYEKAEPLYREALHIFKKLNDQLSIAISLNNLAILYQNQGRYEKAESHYIEALHIFKKSNDQLSIATSFNNLAILYEDQGQYEKAGSHYKDALHIYKRLLGEEHLSVANSYWNIGILYDKRGDISKAEEYIQRAILIAEATIGIDHPQTQTFKSFIDQSEYKSTPT